MKEYRFFLRLRFLLLLFVLSLTVSGCSGEAKSEMGRMILPVELEWVKNEKLHGLETVVLAGDPSTPHPYAQRIRLAPGTRLEPHFHPNTSRMVTVLEGTLYFAYGDSFREQELRAMPPGSFFTEPANAPHYAVAGSQEVVLELHANGVDGTTYVGEQESY
ncbi:MAG: cupin domain-containing protein [Chlorobium sp.]|nr:cupin domain-containing protein [Chlorobium phaeovibrioides]NQU46916.1 cupin domain-containing protein [Chlorobium sp.]